MAAECKEEVGGGGGSLGTQWHYQLIISLNNYTGAC